MECMAGSRADHQQLTEQNGTCWCAVLCLTIAMRTQSQAWHKHCCVPLTRRLLLVGSPAKRPVGSAHTLCGASACPDAASSAAMRASASTFRSSCTHCSGTGSCAVLRNSSTCCAELQDTVGWPVLAWVTAAGGTNTAVLLPSCRLQPCDDSAGQTQESKMLGCCCTLPCMLIHERHADRQANLSCR